MGKRSLHRRVIPKCKGNKGSCLPDRISLLPDDILISILALLPLEEAARTCALSHQWKSLGVSYHGNLVFDGTRVKDKMKMVEWVNQVLRSHQGSTIDRFKICFNFKKCSQDHLNKWLQLLSAKLNGIKSFELEFSPFNGYYRPMDENMCLPSLPLAPFSSLTSLSLKSLNGTNDFLQGILNNCLLLENLCIANSEGPAYLIVSGSFLRLKYLEIVQWDSLKKVEVYAPNLSKFKYYGDEINLFFDKVPQLTNVSIGSKWDHLGFAVAPLSSCFSHLKTLSLQPKFLDWGPLSEQPPRFPPMPSLIHLELQMMAFNYFNLLDWASMIVRLPALQTLKTTVRSFSLVVNYIESPFPLVPFSLLGGENDFIGEIEKPHHHCSLKTLEIFGFEGYPIDFCFAWSLVENAVELEKLVIGIDKFTHMPRARMHAMKLEKCLREGARFELL